MNKRRRYVSARKYLISLSIICLLAAVVFLVKFFANNKSQEVRESTPVEVTHRVLFLSSYNPLYFTYDAQAKGLNKSLYPKGIEYDVVYMDSKLHGSQKEIRAFYEFFKDRYDRSKYEAVILGDDAALEFALEYQEELFPKMPMIFFGINDYALAERAAQTPYMAGFYENNYLEETMNLAIRLFPERKTLVALHDQSAAGLSDIEIFLSLREKYRDYAFVDMDSMLLSQEDLISLLSSLPKDSILFYMTCYTDKYGNVYSMLSRTNTIVQHTAVPIFRNYVGGEGMGILGGVYMDFEDQCAMVGDVMASILSGTDVANVPFFEQTPKKCEFDYQLMKDYDLNFSILPEDTVFFNEPDTFLRHYGNILPVVSLIFFALILLILSSDLGKKISLSLVDDLRASRDNLIESEKLLRYQAEYDEVLDILNRRTITGRLRDNMTPEDKYAVVLIDIDEFKAINENYGHAMADSILQYLTALFKVLAEEGNWQIARFGGDEFLFVIPGESLTRDCAVVRKIMDIIRSPIPIGGETLTITASMGVSNSDGVILPEEHIIDAENAMYEAKAHGRNGVVIYDEKMKEKLREELLIKEKLQQAFSNDGFYMLYQPQIDAKTKKICGYEALVRMKESGIYPGQFIPIAEKSGWIWKIGRITTELVIKQLAAWRDAGHELRPVSVNYSSNQLNDHGYVDFVERLLKEYDIPSRFLEIEITESLFLEKSALADEVFRRFKELGIRLLMDDFGTGYSSLGYLTYIPVDVIKLDKSLVDTYLVDGKDMFIKNIIHLMHDLDKGMIIEGVEEEWQYNRLRDFGADTIQGYYFSKPIPADDAIVFNVG